VGWDRPVAAAGDASWTGSTLRGEWSSVGRRCLIQPYPIKRVISDTLGPLLAAGNRADSMESKAVGGKHKF
jgi:hypothetical protein